MTERDLPVMLCEPVGSGGDTRWRFWCPFCRAWHQHGAKPGHRAAHCAGFRSEGDALVPSRSPFKSGGYVLRLDPRYDGSA